MPYVQQADVSVDIPPSFIVEALDDDGDGVADVGLWDQVAAAASTAVDSRLGQRYATPFVSPIPAIVTEAARIFASEMLYNRRGVAKDKNPFTEAADALREKLDLIGQGKQPLTPAIQRQQPSASVITERSKTFSVSGALPI